MDKGHSLFGKPLLELTPSEFYFYKAVMSFKEEGRINRGLILYPGHKAYKAFARVYPSDPKTGAVVVPSYGRN